ncbi:sigma 54-interacting transcriptional regulator [Cytobacillus firmus]|uniref:sigma-54 interaction domain-containing protein n=1 Tax=Cytobacillus firmus TaxID=1399 RepID=UPI001331B4B1|nr:sigma 54-interacting transcriptional regulator [Cytobacillus firmus]
MLEELLTEMKSGAAKFFQSYPVKADVLLTGMEWKNFHQNCQIASKIRKTGINALVKQKSDHSTCMSCSAKDLCSIETAAFSPIFIQKRVAGIIVITPIKEQREWFLNNWDFLELQLDLCSEWAGAKLENHEMKKENNQFLGEINGIFHFIHEPILIAGRDGTIHNISNSLCSMLNKTQAELIGEHISEIISVPDWLKLTKIANQQEMKVSLHTSKTVRKSEPCLARLKPILSAGQIESFLIQLNPILKSMKKEDKRFLYSFHDVKGTSEAIQRVVEIAKRVAPSDSSVLLRGESGTGKEVFAQSIHQASNRKDGPFIAINCAAIPESLLESELFGHVKGAFTGSNADKPGRFEMANGGTIFLDEIGDLSLHLQAKLLRVIQERKIERVGDTKTTGINVRIITATHRNLEELVSEGQFREDLYYRLNVIPITIPPLRERKEDIPILVEYFLKSFSQKLFRSPKRLSKDVIEILLQYHWAGNIRELQNVVHHFMQLEIGDLVTIKSLPVYLSDLYKSQVNKNALQQIPAVTSGRRKKHSDEKEQILKLLDQFGRDTTGKKKVAEQLNISLPTLYRRISKMKIK